MAEYYIRLKGTILGPCSLDQIRSMQGQGRLSAFHEISTDRVRWLPLSSFAELSPPNVELVSQPPKAMPTAAPVARPFRSKSDIDSRRTSGRYRDEREETEGHDRLRPRNSPGNTSWALPTIIATAVVGAAAIVIVVVALILKRPADDRGLATKGASKADNPKAVIAKSNAPHSNTQEKAPARKALKDLFVELAPSVPMVQAGNSGGSGFLIARDDRYLVVTNRHVVEKAKSGVEVHFFPSSGKGVQDKLVIRPSEAKVTSIHRTVDLALIDVTAATDKINAAKIAPVRISPRDHAAAVGEEVFAIGHPGGDNSTGVLTRSLANGIVSAVHRKNEYFRGTFSQVTIPINPGNSGGPIFDLEGKVVAMATFIIRKGQDQRTLEGLNFGLELSFLHDLLQDSSHSLNATEIAGLANPAGFVGGRDVERIQGKLLSSDPFDPVANANCHHRVHLCKMTAGRLYQIDLTSTWDNYLRLEDSTGLNLREDDDSGGNLNARIVFFPTRTDTYRIIVTSFRPLVNGPYSLRIQEK